MKSYFTAQTKENNYILSVDELVPTKKTEIDSRQVYIGKTNFSFDQTQVSIEDISHLESLKEKMGDYPITLVGYTDNIGDIKVNKVISEQRAKSVLEALVKIGIDKAKIKTISKPLDGYTNNNLNNEQRGANRRVEIFIQKNRRISL